MPTATFQRLSVFIKTLFLSCNSVIPFYIRTSAVLVPLLVVAGRVVFYVVHVRQVDIDAGRFLRPLTYVVHGVECCNMKAALAFAVVGAIFYFLDMFPLIALTFRAMFMGKVIGVNKINYKNHHAYHQKEW